MAAIVVLNGVKERGVKVVGFGNGGPPMVGCQGRVRELVAGG